MSLVIARDPPERLLPALSTLTNYQVHYKEITQYLENVASQKIQLLGQIKCQMESFLQESQSMVEKMIVSIDAKVTDAHKDSQKSQRYQTSSQGDDRELEVKPSNQIKQTTPNIRDHRSISKRSTRPKLKNKNKQETNQNKTTKKTHELTQKEREQTYHQIIKKQRQRNYSQEKKAKDKMRRNTNYSQAQLKYFLSKFMDSQKQVYSIKLLNKVYIHICTMCDMWIHTSQQKSKIARHYFKYHKVKINPDQPAVIEAEQLYQLYKKKIDTEDLVYYRCNCMIDPCSSKEEYLYHIKQNHDNNIPPYSSHIFRKNSQIMMEQPQDSSLIMNPQYNQYCVLEDIIIGDIFYCGQCQMSFRYCAQLYYDHLNIFHKGIDDHPANSHVLKKRLLIANSEKPRQKRRGITIQNFVNDQKIKYERKTIKQKKLLAQNKKYKLDNEVTYYDHFNEQGDQFPEQKIFLEALQSYNGPFICSHCNKDFQNFIQLKKHFENFDQLGYGFFQQYFFRITVVSLKNSMRRYKYYIPTKFRNPEIYSRILNVPFRQKRKYAVQYYKTMSLGELIDYIKTNSQEVYNIKNKVPSSAFFWPKE